MVHPFNFYKIQYIFEACASCAAQLSLVLPVYSGSAGPVAADGGPAAAYGGVVAARSSLVGIGTR